MRRRRAADEDPEIATCYEVARAEAPARPEAVINTRG